MATKKQTNTKETKENKLKLAKPEGSKVVEPKKTKQTETKKMSLMERLLAKSPVSGKVLSRGQEIEGVVTYVSRKMVLLDIGAKTEGLVAGEDVTEAADLVKEIAVGDKIKAYVRYPENDQGQIILSWRKAAEASRWDRFKQLMDEEKEIEVGGLEVNKGGMVVKVGDMRGFVPTSQFGEKYLGKMDQLLNKSFKVRIIEVDREQNRLIFSEKLVSDAEGLAMKHQALGKVNVGGKFTGTVSGIMPFGVFVTVNIPLGKGESGEENHAKVEGLIHISEISWEKVDDPNESFKVGQEVAVQVIGIEEQAGKLNLSIKRMSDDPWMDVEKNYAIGTKHKGKVVRIAPYGIFINFDRGVDGLIHISKKPADREFKMGDEVEVYVEMLDVANRRMSLGVVPTEIPVGYR